MKIKNWNCFHSINKKKWLKEGFVIQSPSGDYILGQGPFGFGYKARPYSLYRPDFFLNKAKPWIYPTFIYRLNKKELFEFLCLGKKELKTIEDQSDLFTYSQKPSFILFQECFVQFQKSISQNLLEKATPAFYESFSNIAPVSYLLQKLFKNTFHLKQGFLYGCWNEKTGFLGFTPEFLFSLNGDRFSVMALAGTSKRNSPSLFKDKKELKEHEFVVKNLEENLSGLVRWKQKKRSEMIFPPLKHLRTDLTGQWLSKFEFEKVCRILHPTPAVGGYPQKQAYLWLKKQRSQKDRVYFSAPFAFFESDLQSFCLVALRCLEWNNKNYRIFSGSGWIKESQLQTEWHELYLKREQVKSFFR